MPTDNKSIRSVLICHEDSDVDLMILSRWLASFTDLKGIVVLREERGRKLKRIKRELKRSGLLRFLDVLAFRLYYKVRFSKADHQWEQGLIDQMSAKYAAASDVPYLITQSPNSAEAEEFIRGVGCDIMIARCKVILQKRIFSIAKVGTFVMHPGICPEYRNAHGCFWALVNGDSEKVGMTLLQVDQGVDTGPIYGYFSYDYDPLAESHIKIQTLVVTKNLDEIEAKLKEVVGGVASPIDVRGRDSGVWGHPWLTKYLAWRRRAG